MILFSFPNKETVFLTCPWNTPWHKQITQVMPFQVTDEVKLRNQLYSGEKMTEADENTPGSPRTLLEPALLSCDDEYLLSPQCICNLSNQCLPCTKASIRDLILLLVKSARKIEQVLGQYMQRTIISVNKQTFYL